MGLRYGETVIKHRILPLLFRNGNPKCEYRYYS